MKKQLISLGLITLLLVITIEARSFESVPVQALLRRGASAAFSRGFQPTEARLASCRNNDSEMIQASLRDAGMALRFRGLKPTAKVSRRSATKSAPNGLVNRISQGRVTETAALSQIALKTPELYSQCAQPLKDVTSANASLAALKDPAAKKRIAAADALAKSCDARAVEPLLAALKEDKDVEVRIAAAAALGQLGSVDAVDPMIEALADTNARVRAALGHALGSFTVHRARNATLNVLVNPGGAEIKDEADLRARCFGILVVNQMIDVRFSRKAIGFLFGFLDHKDPQLRAIAEATAVELQHTQHGLRELMGIIKVHNYPDFRRKAVAWLGRWGDPEARDLLTETAANDRDLSVRLAAQAALAQLKQ